MEDIMLLPEELIENVTILEAFLNADPGNQIFVKSIFRQCCDSGFYDSLKYLTSRFRLSQSVIIEAFKNCRHQDIRNYMRIKYSPILNGEVYLR